MIGFGALGVVAFVLGAALLTNFRGSALAYSNMMKNYKLLGVDYSKSFLVSPLFIRLFGAFYMFIGTCFVVATITQIQQPVVF